MAKSNKETKGTKEEIMSNAELRGHHYAKRIAPKLAEAIPLAREKSSAVILCGLPHVVPLNLYI